MQDTSRFFEFPEEERRRFEGFSEEESRRIEEFAAQIDIRDLRMVNSFGSGAQKDIAMYSASVLRNVKSKELGEVGSSLAELKAAIDSTSAPEKKGIWKLFQRGKKEPAYSLENYKSAEVRIEKTEKDLRRHQQTLLKDVFVFEQMYDLNLKSYRELTMYIFAGKKILENAGKTTLAQLKQKAEMTQNPLDIRNVKDYEEACKRFEKRVYDLETTRLVSMQMAPQIRLLQETNQEIAEKLHSNIINTIPLWRNQMALALGMERSKNALDAQKELPDMTGAMIAAISQVAAIYKEEINRRAEVQEALEKMETERQQNGGMQNDGLQSDGLQNGGLQSDGLQSDGLQNGGLQNGGLQNGGLQSDGLQNGSRGRV